MEQSPEQIAGRLALEKGSMRISHESIYRFIDHRVRNKDYSWHKLLPQAKFYRGRRPKKGGPPSKTFTDYVSIDARPEAVGRAAGPSAIGRQTSWPSATTRKSSWWPMNARAA